MVYDPPQARETGSGARTGRKKEGRRSGVTWRILRVDAIQMTDSVGRVAGSELLMHVQKPSSRKGGEKWGTARESSCARQTAEAADPTHESLDNGLTIQYIQFILK